MTVLALGAAVLGVHQASSADLAVQNAAAKTLAAPNFTAVTAASASSATQHSAVQREHIAFTAPDTITVTATSATGGVSRRTYTGAQATGFQKEITMFATTAGWIQSGAHYTLTKPLSFFATTAAACA